MALVTSGGNTYVFEALAAAGTATLDLEDAVKKVMFNNDIVLCNDDFDEQFECKANVLYEFPNIFGYPSKLFVKNTGNAGIIPKVFVAEYGDAIADDYFAAPAALL